MKDIIKTKNLEEVKKYVSSSGTLSTAKHAFQQGKKVFVGNVEDGDLDIEELIKENKE